MLYNEKKNYRNTDLWGKFKTKNLLLNGKLKGSNTIKEWITTGKNFI